MEAKKLARILLFLSRCKALRAATRIRQGEEEERDEILERGRCFVFKK